MTGYLIHDIFNAMSYTFYILHFSPAGFKDIGIRKFTFVASSFTKLQIANFIKMQFKIFKKVFVELKESIKTNN